ncbi:MAG: hypothetical protein H6621_12830 [Halobacteriovoraceae bacterium]|nr:hypothetical protein [Halobacteriovoraceae bacterium]MCB9095946.1 hypothetical protein [Halobacteriovoraceae bacterium]
MKKFKITFFLVLIIVLVVAKYILFDYPVSTGKRVGNLTKLSHKGKIIKTWEGTIDEGSGDKLTTYFSVKDNELAKELYEFKGRKVILFYEEYIVGWPRDTKYNIVSWQQSTEEAYHTGSTQHQEPEEEAQPTSELYGILGKTLFCSFLGTLINDKELYQQVKEYIKNNNQYLYRQYDKCND